MKSRFQNRGLLTGGGCGWWRISAPVCSSSQLSHRQHGGSSQADARGASWVEWEGARAVHCAKRGVSSFVVLESHTAMYRCTGAHSVTYIPTQWKYSTGFLFCFDICYFGDDFTNLSQFHTWARFYSNNHTRFKFLFYLVIKCVHFYKIRYNALHLLSCY